MAEIKNLFLKSKMNQDLDDRLVPSGEYRQAQNVMISKSEGSDVGALENVLGNELVNDAVYALKEWAATGSPTDIDIIGINIDTNTDRIFMFVTNYIDTSQNNLLHPQLNNSNSFTNIFNAIVCYNISTTQVDLLVQGTFLNFSKNSIITGSNVLENLLFWTDNRNQPRKINIINALNNQLYYTTEDQISVAKYYPYKVPRLWALEDCNGVQVPQPQMKNKTNPTNPVNYGQSLFQQDGITPTNPNPTYDATYTGDSTFLEDKFVRFAYRFKFDDGEVSLMSPFTQPAFIPKQDGYFALNLEEKYLGIGDGINSTQEDNAYKSTIVDWFENKVDSVNVYIDLPCQANLLRSKLKVESIEILYKESDALSVKVVKELNITESIFNTTNSFINWEYQSTKPIKTLPERETTRVFDRVPVRALSQEVVGNRVVYGNYTTSNPYPKEILYKVGVSEKLPTSVNPTSPTATVASSRVAYPNHTVKQNRTYQVGLVLADRFGRQTPVILTPNDVVEEVINGITFRDSTLFHPYRDAADSNLSIGGEELIYWVGDSIKLLFNDKITVADPLVLNNGLYDEEKNPLGWYSYKVVVKQTEQDYYNVYMPGMLDGYLEFTADAVINTVAHGVLLGDNINKIPRDLKEVGPNQAVFTSSVKFWGRVNNIATRYQVAPLVSPYSKLTLNQPYNSQYYPDQSPDSVITIGTLQDLALGQRKTVTLSGETSGTTVTGAGSVIYTKRFSSNIFDNCTVVVTSPDPNTIPVGALVKNYRENPDFITDGTGTTPSTGFEGMFNIDAEEYPFTIANNAALTFTNPTFYNAQTNPLVLRAKTKKSLGSYVSPGPDKSLSVLPELSVLETSPVTSNIDIYWETSTSGLISDLNEESQEPFGARDIGPEWRFIGDEGDVPGVDNLLAQDFYAIDQIGAQVPGFFDSSQSSVLYPTGPNTNATLSIGLTPNDFFLLEAYGTSPYQTFNLKLNPGFNGGAGAYWTFLQNYAQSPFAGNLTFNLAFVSQGSTTATILTEQGQVANVQPSVGLVNFDPVPGLIDFTWPNYLECVNGTSNPNTNTQQIIAVLESQVNILNDQLQTTGLFSLNQVFSSTGSPVLGSFSLSVDGSSVFNEPGTYTLIVRITDANGFGADITSLYSIIIKEPALKGRITRGNIQYGMWSGHVGLFAKYNFPSSNDRDPDFSAQYCRKPAQMSPIPSMLQTIKDIGNNGYVWGPSVPNQWGWNGSLGTWPREIYKEAFDPGGDNDFGLIMDYVATYTSSGEMGNELIAHDLAWPEGFSTSKNIGQFWGDGNSADVNFVDFTPTSTRPGGFQITPKPGPSGLEYSPGFPAAYNSQAYGPQGVLSCNKFAPVVGQGLIATTVRQITADRTGYPVVGNEFSWAPMPYDGTSGLSLITSAYDPTKYLQNSTSGGLSVTKSYLQASATVGHKFGWGYMGQSKADGYENGGGDNDDSGNTWTIPSPGRGSSSTIESDYSSIAGWNPNARAKFWESFVGGTFNTTVSQGKPGSQINFTNGWSNIIVSEISTYTTNQSAKSEDIKFRNRMNLQLGEKGITQGTALIKLVIDFNNVADDATWTTARGGVDGLLFTQSGTSCYQDGSLFSNFLIQYRVDANSPWEDALDINDRRLSPGLWDYSGRSYISGAGYGGGSALFWRSPDGEDEQQARGIDARWVRNGTATQGTGIKFDMASAVGYQVETWASTGPLTNPTQYFKDTGAGMVKIKDNEKQYTCAQTYTDIAQKSYESGIMPYGMGIMNYSATASSPAQATTRGFAEMTFAVDKIGDYRFVFDNLRQGLSTANTIADVYGVTSPINQAWDGARPIAAYMLLGGGTSNFPNPGITNLTQRVLGPGVSVMVHDLYNKRPDHGHWGKNSPSAPFVSKGNNPNFEYDSNSKDADYVFYAYTVAKLGRGRRIEAIDFPSGDWDPRDAGTVQYLFAKEPVPRYVKNWYTRTRLNAASPWVYSLYKGDLSYDAWYAFTVQPVSIYKNTIPDPSRATAFSFPEEAGVPYGFEQAYGPLAGDNGIAITAVAGSGDRQYSGVYPTWAFELEGGGTGKIISSPSPVSYLDIFPDDQPQWMPTLDWNALPKEQG
jgi:hypothetical protein